MPRIRKAFAGVAALGGVLSLGACAVPPPTGPSVMALPGQGKSFAQFQQEDAGCRQFAFAQTGGPQAAQGPTNAAVGSALLATALGAGAGAAIGSTAGAVGAGAAIGGAFGLLTGSAIGANNAAASAGALQNRYDMSYAQCMVAQGNSVQPGPGPGPYGPPPYGPAPYPAAYGYPAYGYPYAYPPVVVGPTVAVGWGWGGGWGWRGGGWRGGWHRW
jgi:hypothetical protein